MSKQIKHGRRRSGALLMWLGAIIMLAGLALGGYNVWDERRASQSALEVATQLAALALPQQPAQPAPAPAPVLPADPAQPDLEPTPQVPDYVVYPEKEMPRAQVNGRDCLGLLEIPALERTLPVLAQADEEGLKYAPGCYAGSVYEHNMVIAGHNYTSHFGKLRTLQLGQRVVFIDLDGNRFVYEVGDMETLQPTDIEEMITGDWDLTLFTCTYGNRQRIALRCYLLENGD